MSGGKRRLTKSPVSRAGRTIALLHRGSRDGRQRHTADSTRNGKDKSVFKRHANGGACRLDFPVGQVQAGGPCLVTACAGDFTADKQSGESPGKERDLILTVVETSGALMVVIDKEGRIVRFKP